MLLHYVLLGLVMGASSGLMPGPIFNCMISESLQHGVWAGFKVGIAPLSYAVVMIPVIFLLAYFFHTIDWLMVVIALLGGFFIIKLSISTMRYHLQPPVLKNTSMGFCKASMVNFLNPYAYLFWSTAGVAIVGHAYHVGVLHAFAFFISYYSVIAVANTLIVVLIGRYRNMLNSRVYTWMMRLLGVTLFCFGVGFIGMAMGRIF